MKCPMIYKIYCKNPEIKDCYIGSTCNFKNRVSNHKSAYNTENNKLYECIRNNGGWDNWEFTIINEYRISMTTNELLKKEKKYIEKFIPALNQNIPTGKSGIDTKIILLKKLLSDMNIKLKNINYVDKIDKIKKSKKMFNMSELYIKAFRLSKNKYGDILTHMEAYKLAMVMIKNLMPRYVSTHRNRVNGESIRYKLFNFESAIKDADTLLIIEKIKYH